MDDLDLLRKELKDYKKAKCTICGKGDLLPIKPECYTCFVCNNCGASYTFEKNVIID